MFIKKPSIAEPHISPRGGSTPNSVYAGSAPNSVQLIKKNGTGAVIGTGIASEAPVIRVPSSIGGGVAGLPLRSGTQQPLSPTSTTPVSTHKIPGSQKASASSSESVEDPGGKFYPNKLVAVAAALQTSPLDMDELKAAVWEAVSWEPCAAEPEEVCTNFVTDDPDIVRRGEFLFERFPKKAFEIWNAIETYRQQAALDKLAHELEELDQYSIISMQNVFTSFDDYLSTHPCLRDGVANATHWIGLHRQEIRDSKPAQSHKIFERLMLAAQLIEEKRKTASHPEAIACVYAYLLAQCYDACYYGGDHKPQADHKLEQGDYVFSPERQGQINKLWESLENFDKAQMSKLWLRLEDIADQTKVEDQGGGAPDAVTHVYLEKAIRLIHHYCKLSR